MFAKLTGRIDSISQNTLILDVNGVGYLVLASNRTLSRIGSTGDTASLLIETQVRETDISLFGFCDALEKEWFKRLTSVQGVGPKAGLALMSACPPEQLSIVIASGDKAALTQADGVGPKLAARILTELKDKVSDLNFGDTKQSSSTAPASKSGQGETSAVMDDALSALINLGYGRAEAYTALAQVRDQSNDLSDLITLGLKKLTA